MRPRSLRAILAIYVAIFLVALLAVRAANYSVTHHALGQEVDRRLASEAAAIIGPRDRIDEPAMIGRIAAAQADHDTADLFYLLVDSAGRRRAGSLHLASLPPLGYSDFGEEANVDGVAHGRAFARKLPSRAVLVVVSDNDVVDSFDALLFRVQAIGLGTTALIVIGGALGIAIAIGGRMRAMQRTVDAVIEGDLRSRIPLDGSRSEFDRQAAAFNRMLDRIDELMMSVKHAAKDVTHELKSPLARLRARTAALARHSADDPIGPDIEGLLEQTDQILDLFSSLLRLWEIEGGHRRERFVDIDLTALAAEVAEGLLALAEDSGDMLEIDAAGPVPVRGDLNLLRQMLVNLIENAVRHTPPGTRIMVGTQIRDGQAMMTVSDDGPGIPAEHHATVIRRFGRMDADNQPPGQGLGLTLVDAIARLHHGLFRLEDAGPGLRAVVELPLRA
ncbi:HAMP domain-containing sensor histidine kinase [Sphingomonas sp. ZT3P38]|uniref:sensor histidine kinase n=1 Tax=Parasphingomonas zepuensis TaxID=3096161 RepID=UPI002FC67C4C